jgi:hypothetical protein
MKTMTALAAIALVLTGPAGTAAAAADQDQPVEITVDHDQTTATVGQIITIQTHLTNPTNTPTSRLLAHVNVASTDPETYVDLEDWSTDVTRSLAPIPAHDDPALTWTLHAVNEGTFTIYTVLLPEHGPLIVSPAAHLQVTGRPRLNAGGALPVVIAVPLLLALLTGVTRHRRRTKPDLGA